MITTVDGWAVGDYGTMLRWNGTTWANWPGLAAPQAGQLT
jgi:hypothetical protein